LTLRDIHDFELALLAPLMSMTLKGVKVDEEKRLELIRDLKESREPQAQKIQDIIIPLLKEAKRIPDKHLFRDKWTCACCRDGKVKSQACWGCAGFEKMPTKKQIVGIIHLTPCRMCSGVGRGEEWSFNPSSPSQVKIALYNLLRLPKRMKKKKLSSDEEALKSLVQYDQSGFVKALLQVVKTTTMLTILKRIKGGIDGRLRTVYNPAGTETGRLNSSETFLFASTNLQNLPKKVVAVNPLYNVKKCIVPDTGTVWLQADLSQAEARVVAALANDTELLKRWEDPEWDCHRFTAAIATGKAEADVTKKERDYLGKKARHANNYGVGAFTFSNDINKDADVTGFNITKREAQAALDRLAKVHYKTADWWRGVDKEIRTTGSITTCFGRKRTFFARRRGDGWLDSAHLEAIAFEPQSTVADLLNTGLMRWWDLGEGTLGTLMLQIHDAIIIQTPTSLMSRAARFLRDCLEIPITVNGTRLTIPADIEIMRTSWGESEDYEI